jgi:hypothetical protein
MNSLGRFTRNKRKSREIDPAFVCVAAVVLAASDFLIVVRGNRACFDAAFDLQSLVVVYDNSASLDVGLDFHGGLVVVKVNPASFDVSSDFQCLLHLDVV